MRSLSTDSWDVWQQVLSVGDHKFHPVCFYCYHDKAPLSADAFVKDPTSVFSLSSFAACD
jgi:hypothetical protein